MVPLEFYVFTHLLYSTLDVLSSKRQSDSFHHCGCCAVLWLPLQARLPHRLAKKTPIQIGHPFPSAQFNRRMSTTPPSKRQCTTGESEPDVGAAAAVAVAVADAAVFKGGASTHVPAERGPEGYNFEYLDHTADIQYVYCCCNYPRMHVCLCVPVLCVVLH
jgi:hypothetical protein